jgi:hypothetical protein
MKIVNINDMKSVNSVYFDIPQPMYAYHSNDEFKEYVMKEGTPYIMIQNFPDYYNFLKKNNIDVNYRSENKFVDLQPYNVWIQTIDKYMPDYADIDGTIYYKFNTGESKYIETDGCWIKLYKMTPTSSKHILYTSSGVHTVGINKWDVTAAIRTQFQNERDTRRGGNKEFAYKTALERLIKLRKPNVRLLKASVALLSSDSPTFLDVNAVMRNQFPNIKKQDRYVVLQSEAFRRSIMEVIKILMPELGGAIRKNFDPDKMGKMLDSMWNIAEDSKNVDSMLKIFNRVTEVGYEEIEARTTSGLLPNNAVPALPNIAELDSKSESTFEAQPKQLDVAEVNRLKKSLSSPDIAAEKPRITIAELEGFLDEDQTDT